jgi:DNA-binding transcriptional regulator YdaS (Cro superfamily)
MTPEELAKAGVTLYGKWGWQTRMAEALGVDGSTVRRWVSGAVPVPGPVVAALTCLLGRCA